MRTEGWRRLEDIFHRARALPPPDRSRFLEEICRDDPAMRAEIASLLQAFEASAEFLAAPPGEPGAAEPAADPRIGSEIGSYRILEVLGAGGMSIVYRACRADREYEQEVAVKLVEPGPAGAFASRLRRERQILARLDHPRVARLFDGGTTADGRPYFVMELIDGQPIHRYCDQRRLGVERRLGLFRQVCEAVQYAHRNLVLHCDLKPSNILVLADGTPRLLDFGIAKLLDPARFPGPEDVTLTRFRPMTPAYASPEQRRGEALTIASDVFSLGVVLYELLTGRLPHDDRDRSRPVGGTEPQVRPPSSVVARSQAGAPPAGRAAWRRPTSARRRRPLSRDLDAIVLKALRHEPESRYPSVEALLDDLRRYAAGLPVAARRGTRAYRAGKFLRRRWLPVASAAVVLILLVGFTLTTTQQARRLASERDKAERIGDFVIELFRVNDPSAARGNTVTARELMDDAVVRIEQMSGQGEIQAALLDAIGRIYLNLGLYPQADDLTRRALGIRRRLYPAVHPEVVDSLATRGELLAAMGRYGAAAETLEEALSLRREAAGPAHPAVAEILTGQIEPLVRLNRFAVAEAKLVEAIEIRRRQRAPDPVELARLETYLAFVLGSPHTAGGRARALALYRRALPALAAGLGAEAPEVLAATRNFASLLRSAGELAEAERLFRRVLASERRIYGPRHPHLGFTLNHLGLMLSELGRAEEAEAHLRESLAVRRATLPASHPAVGVSMNGLGTALLRRGQDHSAAEELFRQSLEIIRGGLGQDHIMASYPLHGLGRALIAQGRAAEAREPLRLALEIRQARLPANDPGIATVRRDLGRIAAEPPRL